MAMMSSAESARIMRRILLAIFMIVQAPLSGAMAAHMSVAQADTSGPGEIVICSHDGPKSMAWSGSQTHDEKSKTGCYCPCAATCGFCSLAARHDNSTSARYFTAHADPVVWDGAESDDSARLNLHSCGSRSPPHISI